MALSAQVWAQLTNLAIAASASAVTTSAGNASASNSTVGIGGDETASTSSWQLFYAGEAFDGNFLASVGYSYDQNTGIAVGTSSSTADRNSYSIAAAWKPADSGLIPSISTGYSASDVEVKVISILGTSASSGVMFSSKAIPSVLPSVPHLVLMSSPTPCGRRSTASL